MDGGWLPKYGPIGPTLRAHTRLRIHKQTAKQVQRFSGPCKNCVPRMPKLPRDCMRARAAPTCGPGSRVGRPRPGHTAPSLPKSRLSRNLPTCKNPPVFGWPCRSAVGRPRGHHRLAEAPRHRLRRRRGAQGADPSESEAHPSLLGLRPCHASAAAHPSLALAAAQAARAIRVPRTSGAM